MLPSLFLPLYLQIYPFPFFEKIQPTPLCFKLPPHFTSSSHRHNFLKLIYLAASGLNCSTQGLLIKVCGLSSCGAGLWDLSSPIRDQTRVPCIARWFLTRTTREVSKFHELNDLLSQFYYCSLFCLMSCNLLGFIIILLKLHSQRSASLTSQQHFPMIITFLKITTSFTSLYPS